MNRRVGPLRSRYPIGAALRNARARSHKLIHGTIIAVGSHDRQEEARNQEEERSQSEGNQVVHRLCLGNLADPHQDLLEDRQSLGNRLHLLLGLEDRSLHLCLPVC